MIPLLVCYHAVITYFKNTNLFILHFKNNQQWIIIIKIMIINDIPNFFGI
jgi:hypothetical protein